MLTKRSRSTEKSAIILESRRIQFGSGLKILANRSAWLEPATGSVARRRILPVLRSKIPRTSTLTSLRFPSVKEQKCCNASHTNIFEIQKILMYVPVVVVPKEMTPSSTALSSPPRLIISS